MAPNLNSEDYYEILGCSRNADDNALKKAYKKLAVKWHPDKNPGNEDATTKFQKISEAYATLSDPKKRQVYDQYGKDGVNAADQMGEDGASHFAGGGRPGFHFRPGGGGGNGFHQQHMSQEDAQAFFTQFFGNDDPFGGMGGGRHFGGSRGGGIDPSTIMFQQMGGIPGGMGGMPGGMGGMHHFGGMPGGMGGQMPRQQRVKRYDAIPNETPVSLKGLISRPDMNGERGEVAGFDPSSGRYVVAIEDSDEQIRVKPSNLLQHVHVRLSGIESQPEMNGKSGTIIAWNEEKERYNIYVTALRKVVSLKPSNVVLNDGVVAMVVGLNAKPEFNGKYGTIVSWVRETNRYELRLSEKQIIRVKIDNVRV